MITKKKEYKHLLLILLIWVQRNYLPIVLNIYSLHLLHYISYHLFHIVYNFDKILENHYNYILITSFYSLEHLKQMYYHYYYITY